MVENIIKKVRQKLYLKECILFFILSLPVLVVIFLVTKNLFVISQIIFVSLILWYFYMTAYYRNPANFDRRLKLNNAFTTYFAYKNSDNPFTGRLKEEVENKLSKMDINILPDFDVWIIPITLSIFVFMVFLSRNREGGYEKTVIDNRGGSAQDNIQYNAPRSQEKAENKNYSLPLDSLIKLSQKKGGRTIPQKSIGFQIKNEISKKERKFINDFLNENSHNR